MNKQDKIFIGGVLVFIVLIYFFSGFLFSVLSSNRLEAVVYKQDKEYARLDMAVNQELNVPGNLGDVIVEIQDQKVRIKTETSPLHICSLMGWADKANMVLTCLPNSIYVKVENSQADTFDSSTWQLDGSTR